MRYRDRHHRGIGGTHAITPSLLEIEYTSPFIGLTSNAARVDAMTMNMVCSASAAPGHVLWSVGSRRSVSAASGRTGHELRDAPTPVAKNGPTRVRLGVRPQEPLGFEQIRFGVGIWVERYGASRFVVTSTDQRCDDAGTREAARRTLTRCSRKRACPSESTALRSVRPR